MHKSLKIGAALAAFKGDIYQKICIRELSYRTTTKWYKFN
jgi:hypothetical protein